MRLRLATGASRGSVGLDIDGRYLAAVELRDGRIARAASADLPTGLFAGGEVGDATALGAAIRDFFKRHDLPRRVRLGVANQQIVVRSIDLPVIDDPTELAAAVRFQAADAIAMPLDETVLDYDVVGESTGPEGSPRVRVVVAAAREAMVTSLAETVRAAGLRPLGIDLSAFALVRALARAAPDADATSGPWASSTATAAEDVVVSDETRSDEPGSPDGSEAPTELYSPAIPRTPDDGAAAVAPPAEPRSAPSEDATVAPSEEVTVALAEAPPPEGSAQVYCHLAGVTNLAVATGTTCLFTRSLAVSRDSSGAAIPDALAEEIRLSIDYYMAQPGAPAIGELVLSGPGSVADGLPGELGGLVGVPVRTAPALENLDARDIPADDDPHRYTVAAGLALGAVA